MIISICILSAVILQPLLLFLLLRYLIQREKREIRAKLDKLALEWFSAPEGQPHKAAQVLDAMGATVGSAAARSIMANLGQRASSATQLANNAASGLEAQANPLMALLAGGMGRKGGKGAALMHLAQLIGPMLSGQRGNGNTTQPEAPGQGSFSL